MTPIRCIDVYRAPLLRKRDHTTVTDVLGGMRVPERMVAVDCQRFVCGRQGTIISVVAGRLADLKWVLWRVRTIRERDADVLMGVYLLDAPQDWAGEKTTQLWNQGVSFVALGSENLKEMLSAAIVEALNPTDLNDRSLPDVGEM